MSEQTNPLAESILSKLPQDYPKRRFLSVNGYASGLWFTKLRSHLEFFHDEDKKIHNLFAAMQKLQNRGGIAWGSEVPFPDKFPKDIYEETLLFCPSLNEVRMAFSNAVLSIPTDPVAFVQRYGDEGCIVFQVPKGLIEYQRVIDGSYKFGFTSIALLPPKWCLLGPPLSEVHEISPGYVLEVMKI